MPLISTRHDDLRRVDAPDANEFVREVTQPAKQPGPTPTPDSTTQYTGKGNFLTTNSHFKGT